MLGVAQCDDEGGGRCRSPGRVPRVERHKRAAANSNSTKSGDAWSCVCVRPRTISSQVSGCIRAGSALAVCSQDNRHITRAAPQNAETVTCCLSAPASRNPALIITLDGLRGRGPPVPLRQNGAMRATGASGASTRTWANASEIELMDAGIARGQPAAEPQPQSRTLLATRRTRSRR